MTAGAMAALAGLPAHLRAGAWGPSSSASPQVQPSSSSSSLGYCVDLASISTIVDFVQAEVMICFRIVVIVLLGNTGQACLGYFDSNLAKTTILHLAMFANLCFIGFQTPVDLCS